LNKKGTSTKRKTPAVVRYTDYNKNKNSVNYFYNLVSMYFPYRHREFLSDNVQTYQQLFYQNYHIILPNREPFENLTLELNEAWQRLQEGGEPEETWADTAANQEVNRIEEEEELELIRNELLENTEEVDPTDIPDISCTHENTGPSASKPTTATLMGKEEHYIMVTALTKEQSKILYFVNQTGLIVKNMRMLNNSSYF